MVVGLSMSAEFFSKLVMLPRGLELVAPYRTHLVLAYQMRVRRSVKLLWDKLLHTW